MGCGIMGMEDIFVGRLMSEPVGTVSPGTSVREAAQLMREKDIGSVLVVEETDHLLGILTGTDFVTAVADGRSMGDTAVSEFMTEDLLTTTVNESILDVADTMTENCIHHLPVVDDEQVIGMIATSDLTAYISRLDERASVA